MNWIKNIVHPHAYILFYIIISFLALIPNGLGWRGDMLEYTQEYVGLSILYILFYLLGYYLKGSYKLPEKRKISITMTKMFHFVFLVSFFFFMIKFIYIKGIPLINDSPYLRTKMSQLGGFVDFPTKIMSLLGIIGYYFFIIKKNYLYLIQFFISLILNILFAERSLIIFTIIGALILYIHYHKISIKAFLITLMSVFLMLFFIGWVQIVRMGGKNKLNKSGTMTTAEVATWVVHGDLTGSQKFGAYIADKTENNRLYGRYTLGSYISLFVPSFEEHGAEYLKEKYTNSRTAQSAAIPYSYYIDFGYFSLIFPFIIGYISRFIYVKFKHLQSPFYTILYPVYFFSLLWTIRSGNFPIDPKFIYYTLVLTFIFSPIFEKKLNKKIIIALQIIFLLTIALSFMMLLIRW